MSTDAPPIANKDSRRERRIWTTIVVVGVLVAIAVVALGWNVVQGRLDAAKKLDRAISLLKQAIPTVGVTDAVVRADVTTATADRASELEPTLGDTRANLLEASALIDQGYSKLTDDERKQATRVQAAALARVQMLDAAPAIFSAMKDAVNAKWFADNGWSRTLAADQLARQSVADYNQHGIANVKNASALSTSATAGFTAARALFSQAASAFPDAKLEVYVAYVDRRLALATIAKQADIVWLAGDAAQANKLLAAYNSGDAAAAAAAAKLPVSPIVAIADAYKVQTAAPMDAYLKARQRAAEADAALKSL